MKLGTLLLRDAVITLSQLEEALRAQVVFGGRLGTNLVELGFVDLNTLGLCLARCLAVPLATQERFEAVPAGAITAFPVQLADEFVAFPLGPEPSSADTLGVALSDPRKIVVDELSSRLGRFVAPYVAPELRILYHIERSYGLQRSARFLRSADRDAPPGGERRRLHPARDVPQPVRFEPRRSKPRDTRPPTSSLREARVSYLTACQLIDAAGHRDEIADSLLQFCAGRFALAVLFILRGGNAIGWRALGGDGKAARAVDKLVMPLGASSALQIAHDTALPYRGVAPSAGRPIEREMWRELGVDSEPDEIVVVPVVVRKRVVNLLYVHGFAGSKLDDEHCDELLELVSRTALAYVRLIQAARDGEPVSPAE